MSKKVIRRKASLKPAPRIFRHGGYYTIQLKRNPTQEIVARYVDERGGVFERVESEDYVCSKYDII
jgi:hypothetical protein